ncbi:DUF421 domain-containing protein [Aliiglaciecola litoralis]|uniref:DUF421 domain-containing protein n=1 Tax=Aliiglaciecola litoralis TaxID=582857 RepID=A0ABN1LH81_9ALTE
MFEKWITSGGQLIPWVLLSVLAAYIAILLYTRIVGLRSLSKMSAADFVMTIAIGSLFASTVSLSSPSLLVGLTALAAIYFGQWLIAWARKRSKLVSRLIDNRPILLMTGNRIFDHNLALANMTRADLFGKLREANALNYDQVLAVVFETTGDISVLHSSDENAHLEADFMDSVIDAHELFNQTSK